MVIVVGIERRIAANGLQRIGTNLDVWYFALLLRTRNRYLHC